MASLQLCHGRCCSRPRVGLVCGHPTGEPFSQHVFIKGVMKNMLSLLVWYRIDNRPLCEHIHEFYHMLVPTLSEPEVHYVHTNNLGWYGTGIGWRGDLC